MHFRGADEDACLLKPPPVINLEEEIDSGGSSDDCDDVESDNDSIRDQNDT